MAENRSTSSSAIAPWGSYALGKSLNMEQQNVIQGDSIADSGVSGRISAYAPYCIPEPPLWNEHEDYYDSSFFDPVSEREGQINSTETASISDLDSIGNFQGASIAPSLGTTGHNVTSSFILKAPNLPNANRFVCNQCTKPFRSQSDLNRHRSSIHDKSSLYFCNVRECRRQKGFARKDNYEVHLRNVHGMLSKDGNQVKGRRRHIVSQMKPTRETGEEFDLKGYSIEELTEMIINEREKRRMEQRRRQEVEEELKNLRKRHEEREDKWLKLLTAKEESA